MFSDDAFYRHWGIYPTGSGSSPAHDQKPTLPSDTKSRLLPEHLRDKKIELQKFVIWEQRDRLREQQREIEELRLLKKQLETGRAVTNLELYRAIAQPLRARNEQIRAR